MRAVPFVTMMLLAGAPLFAQPAQTPASTSKPSAKDGAVLTRGSIIGEIVDNANKKTRSVPPIREPFSDSVSVREGPGELAAYLIAVRSEREGYRALLDAMEARTDKQLGAGPNNSGTTSIAMKGLVPDILALAVENGAVTRQDKGTTLTFRATPAGVVEALRGDGILDAYADYSQSRAARFAARFSIAASFDTSRGPSPGTFTATDQQIASWSARYEIVNHRDPASKRYAAMWADLAHNSDAYQCAVEALREALQAWPGLASWNAELLSKVRATIEDPWRKNNDTKSALAKFRALLEAELPKLDKLTDPPKNVTSTLDEYVRRLTAVQSAIDDVYGFAGTGALLTVDWSTTRDAALPDLYTATGIWEVGLGPSRKTDFTLNAAVSFFRSLPLGAQHQLKSVDLAGQVDHPLGSVWILPAMTATLAGRFSRVPYDTAGPAVESTGQTPVVSPFASVLPKGNIVVVQGKLTIPVKGTGVKIPLSITASNRTELIQEAIVRASFGITLDLDALTSGLVGPKP